MKSGTIIITGGAGFIGSCLLWKLNQEGITNILVVDNLGTSEKWRNLVGKRFLDYIQKDDFLDLIKEGVGIDVSAIIHLGACSSTTSTDAAYYVKNNYEYSKTLARWAEANSVKCIYASSAATYGDGGFGYSDSSKNTRSLRPLNMYGYSKQLFDMWVLNNKLDRVMTGIKFFNVFGPNEYHKGEMMSVVCKKFMEVRDTGRIGLFRSYRDGVGDGEQKRDFIYVKDAVNALYYFLEHPEKSGIFNLGTGVARSWNDLARAMFSALGKEPQIDYIDMPKTLRPKYQYFTEAKMDTLRKAGFKKDFTPLEDAVTDYCTYLRDGSCL